MSISNVFEQEGRRFPWKSCVAGVNAQWARGSSAAYLRQMQGNLAKGMVMDISLWGLSHGGMSWLDGPTGCTGACNISASRVSFSNFTLNRLQVSAETDGSVAMNPDLDPDIVVESRAFAHRSH